MQLLVDKDGFSPKPNQLFEVIEIAREYCGVDDCKMALRIDRVRSKS